VVVEDEQGPHLPIPLHNGMVVVVVVEKHHLILPAPAMAPVFLGKVLTVVLVDLLPMQAVVVVRGKRVIQVALPAFPEKAAMAITQQLL